MKISLLATILLLAATAALAATPADQPSDNTVGAMHTYLLPDLSLKTTFLVPATAPLPGAAFQKTCRCSCGTAKCANDADCGGGEGSCSHFISCCAKRDSVLRFGAADQASHRNELPDIKANCN